jgi:fructokinase
VIVVAGESLIDLAVRADGSVTATPGGGPYNVARALGRLGMEVAFLGRISTDPFGRILRAGLAADGVDDGCITRTDDPTMLAVAEIDADGSAAYRFHAHETAAVGLALRDVPDGLPAATTALHVGSLGLALEPMAATIEWLVLDALPAVLVVADPNVRPAAIDDPSLYRARLDRLLRRVDAVKVSTEDLAWLEPDREPVDAARLLLDRGVAIVLLTDGPRPVRVVTTRGAAVDAAVDVAVLDVPDVPVVDTIGAGDAFLAGFLAAWTRAGRGRAELRDRDAVLAATRFAIEIGTRTVGRAGAAPPTSAELRGTFPGW